MPVLFAVATGVLVAAVQRGAPLAAPLTIAGVLFVLVQVLTPVQTAISHNLGDRMAAFLYDRLTATCVRAPGLAHLEDPALAADLTAARDQLYYVDGSWIWTSDGTNAGTIAVWKTDGDISGLTGIGDELALSRPSDVRRMVGLRDCR